METNSSSSSTHDSVSMSGLQFGKKIYFEDGNSSNPGQEKPNNSSKQPVQPLQGKKSKGVGGSSSQQQQQQQSPKCQVEGCNEDLSGAKAYYCRHKVCALHSKAPRVVVNKIEQRFCQQCSRFHQLGEFDQGKRSCRRRLAGHNERRRKPPPGPLSSRYGRLGSFHEPGRFKSFLLDFSYPRVPPTAQEMWPHPAVHHPGLDRMASNQPWQGHLPSVTAQATPNPPPHATTVYAATENLSPQQNGPLSMVPESSCALSLLSTQPWNNNNNNNPPISGPHRSTQTHLEESYAIGIWGSTRNNTINEIGVEDANGSRLGQFSGELELALQRNNNHGESRTSGSGFGQSSHASNWSL